MGLGTLTSASATVHDVVDSGIGLHNRMALLVPGRQWSCATKRDYRISSNKRPRPNKPSPD